SGRSGAIWRRFGDTCPLSGMTWTPAVHLRSRHGARGRDNARTHLLGKEARSGLHNAYEGIGSNDGHRDLATGRIGTGEEGGIQVPHRVYGAVLRPAARLRADVRHQAGV